MSAFVIFGIANQAQAYGIFYRNGKKKAKAKVKVAPKIAEQVTEHMPETLIEFMFNLGTKLYRDSPVSAVSISAVFDLVRFTNSTKQH